IVQDWVVEEELADLVTALVRATRVDVIRAKRHVLEVLSDGKMHPSVEVLAAVAEQAGAPPLVSPDQLHIDLLEGVQLSSVVTMYHSALASLRADIVGHEALAELHAEGVIVGAGGRPGSPDSRPR